MAATPTRRKRSWTVMVFMTSDLDLELYADLDMTEMQTVGSGPDVNVIVQVDRRRFKHPARFYIKENGRKMVSQPRGQENAGRPSVLENFLEWARVHYPAEKYMLILWGHGFALGFGKDRGNALTVTELTKVLKGFADRAQRKLDLLGFDACSMSTAEIAYQLRDAAQYVVASQLPVPYAGWPYEAILDRITNTPSTRPDTLGRHIVSSFAASYEPPQVALTLVRLDEPQAIVTLKEAVQRLAESLSEAIRDVGQRGRVQKAFETTARNGHNTVERALIDFSTLCGELEKGRHNKAVKTAARQARDAFRNVVMAHQTVPKKLSKGIRGLGVYASNTARRSDAHRRKPWRQAYKRLDLMKNTLWDEVIDKLRSRQGSR